jgi:hypothetical protein
MAYGIRDSFHRRWYRLVDIRKWIAARQYQISLEMLHRKPVQDVGRIHALERIGTLFSGLLVLAGGALVVLHLIFQT